MGRERYAQDGVAFLRLLLLLSSVWSCVGQQVKTRNLKGPASQPWKCKPVKIQGNWHGHYLHDTTFVKWECEMTSSVQQVYQATVNYRPSSEMFMDVNNVFGVAKSRTSTGTVIFLGMFDKVDDCELACFRYSSGGAKCNAYSWHRPAFGSHEWRRQCFAVVDGHWVPHQQKGVVSGRVVRHSTSMQDADGRGCVDRCSGHGVCQNTTGTCICDTGFSGFDCSVEVACDSATVGGRCYTVFEKKTSWKKAQEKCKLGGGTLAILQSKEQQNALLGVFGGCNSAWIGLNDMKEEGSYVWQDGPRATWFNWAKNEPNNKGNEDVVLLRKDTKQWYDSAGKAGMADCYACSYKEGQSSAHGEEASSCARDCSGHGVCGAVTGMCTCEEGYFGADCSKKTPCEGFTLDQMCFVVYPEAGSRTKAEEKCRSRGGQLSGVYSHQHEQKLLQLGRAKGCRMQEMWIGLNDQEREGSWEWSSREMSDVDYVNWLPWEPNNGAAEIGGLSQEEEDGVVMDKFGWTDVNIARSNISCFACEFAGTGLHEASSALSRHGEKALDSPVLFNFFAPDLDPVLRRVSCPPGVGECVDDEEVGDAEPFVCSAHDPNYIDEEEAEAEEEEEGAEAEGQEGDEQTLEEVVQEEEDATNIPPAAVVELPPSKCRGPLPLMNTTAERCWRSCFKVQERFGEAAGDNCRQMCVRLAGLINEDMVLVAAGEGQDVLDFYAGVNISDPSKVGTQGSEEEKQVRTEALVNNVWAAAVHVGQHEKAERAITKLLQAHPNFLMLHYTLGVALMTQGRLQEAKSCFRRCMDSGAVKAQCLTSMGNILLKQGHVEEATRVFLLGTSSFPNYPPLFSGLAAARLQRSNPEEAFASALRAVRLRPSVVHYRLQAALAARRSGNSTAAIEILQEGLKQPGGRDEAALHVVIAEVAEGMVEELQNRRSLRYLEANLCSDRCAWQQGNSSLHGGRIPLFSESARMALRSYRLAIRSLRRLRDEAERCEETFGNETVMKCGRAPPLVEILRLRALMANLLGKLGGWEESLAIHSQILAQRAGFVPSLLGKASAAANLQQHKVVGEAIEIAMQQGMQMNQAPSETRVLYGNALLEHARSLIQEGKLRESLPLLRTAMKVDSSRTLPYAVDAWRLLCRVYYKLKHPEPATYACSWSVKLSPQAVEPRQALQWAEEETKELRRQREFRERARQREQKEKRKAEEAKKKVEEDKWKYQFGDGSWREGKGGGRGNKKGKQGKSPSQTKKVPRGLYDILELKPSCTRSDIKRAYHRLSLKWHPDKNPDNPNTPKRDERKEAESKFLLIVQAYQELLLRHEDGAADDDVHCVNC